MGVSLSPLLSLLSVQAAKANTDSSIIVDRMIRDEMNPTIEECLEPCIYAAYRWLSNHIAGYRDLDSDSMIDEVVDSFRQNSPDHEYRPGLQDFLRHVL